MFRFTKFGRMALVSTVALVCVASLPGCGSKVTPDNYAKISAGMTEAEVKNILGSPTKSETKDTLLGPGTEDVWKDGDKSITILVIGGKVVLPPEKAGF
jgi:hypothetical protein